MAPYLHTCISIMCKLLFPSFINFSLISYGVLLLQPCWSHIPLLMTLFQTTERCKAEKQTRAEKCYEGWREPKTGRAPEMLSCMSTSHRRWPCDGSLWSAMRVLPGRQPPAQARAPYACPASQGTLASATLTAFCRCWKAHSWPSISTRGTVLPPSTSIPLLCHLSHHLLPLGSLPSDAVLPLEPDWANLTSTCLHSVCPNLRFETSAEIETTLLKN